MSFLRWIPTFLAFPLGGLVAMTLFGAADDPLAAAVGGLVVGLSLGGAQWLALGRVAGWRWLAGTAAASAAGLALGVAITGSTTATGAAVLAGAIAGAVVGLVQGVLLRRGVLVAALWTAVVAGTWALGWFVTSLVIVDLDRGHAVFGASGAIVVTLITGAVLRLILGKRAPRKAKTDAVDPTGSAASPAGDPPTDSGAAGATIGAATSAKATRA